MLRARNPDTSVSRDGIFEDDLGHELAHAIVGRHGGLQIDCIILDGVMFEDGRRRVRGGCRVSWHCSFDHPKWHFATTAAAGAVGESLLAGEGEVTAGSLRRLLHDSEFANDLREIRDNATQHLKRKIREPDDIHVAISDAYEVLFPRVAAMRSFVSEQAVRDLTRSRFTLVWTDELDERFDL